MKGDRERAGRGWFALAAACLVAYACNVAARIAGIKFHLDVWHVGDVGEMLLVLAAMALFVGGVLARSAQAAGSSGK